MAILIVDDEPECRKLLAEILSREGYLVRAADGGRLALASVRVVRPELLLLDVRMPDMNGFEVCRRLKDDPHTRRIPVIFISAAGELWERVKGFESGAVDFITKPFQRDELLARVRTHLELMRLRAKLERRVVKRTAELRESERRFRVMADAAPVMIWASGPDKLCTFFNSNWLEFTGRTIEQELGNGWAQGVHPDDLNACYAGYSSAFDARQPFELEYRLRRSDGEYRWLFDRGVPRFATHGRFAGYIGSCVDITDIKQNHDRALATQKLESLGVMAAGVAHDFGNLLGSILAEVDLALLDLPPESEARASVQRIGAVAAYSTEIVRMLMSSAGHVDSDVLQPVNVSVIADQMMRLLACSFSKRAVLHSSFEKDLPAVRGNVTEIRQVIMNLLMNAFEALNDREGTINVSTDRIHLGSERDGNAWAGLPDGEYVRLTVSDTGCGMTTKVRTKIFDQFFTTKSHGRGLGLAVVHGIVRSHGGGIAVTSAPGTGTIFEVLFPAMVRSERAIVNAAVGAGTSITVA